MLQAGGRRGVMRRFWLNKSRFWRLLLRSSSGRGGPGRTRTKWVSITLGELNVNSEAQSIHARYGYSELPNKCMSANDAKPA